MICQKCRIREASGYMEKTIGGEKTRIYLCPECFKQAQLEMFSTIDDFGLFSGMTGMTGRLKCSKCGTTLKQISENCFVGCPNCYVELEGYIKSIVRNIQSATTHIGSSPNIAPKSELNELEAQLKSAVESENYELALKLKERIKALKEKDDGQQ